MWSAVGLGAEPSPRNTRLSSSGLLIVSSWIFFFKTWKASRVPTKERASMQYFLVNRVYQMLIYLFSEYVLLPHFRPRDGTLENHYFQILNYWRVYE